MDLFSNTKHTHLGIFLLESPRQAGGSFPLIPSWPHTLPLSSSPPFQKALPNKLAMLCTLQRLCVFPLPDTTAIFDREPKGAVTRVLIGQQP